MYDHPKVAESCGSYQGGVDCRGSLICLRILDFSSNRGFIMGRRKDISKMQFKDLTKYPSLAMVTPT